MWTVWKGAVISELASVEDDLRRNEGEWNELRDCEVRYAQLMKEKAAAIRTSGGPEEKEILRLEERAAYLNSQIRELQEAIRAGQRARNTANEVLSNLDDAEGLSTWDMLGGGLIADIAKHNRLDSAQDAVERLQAHLSRFKTELADVTIQADLHVSVDGFTRFADFFFDGLFADLAVRAQIHQSQSNVEITRSQIDKVLHQLERMVVDTQREKETVSAQLDHLVLKTEL